MKFPQSIYTMESQYQTIEILGTGAFATVYKGFDIKNRTYVVLKKHKPGADAIDNFNREVASLSVLNHTGIPTLLNAIESPTGSVLVTEYYPAIDLFDAIIKDRVTVNDTKKVFQQLCLIVKYVHSQNVIHSDLKPENVLVTPDLTISIIDWGMSRVKFGNFVSDSPRGSLDYAAPEVVKKPYHIGPENDVWSLGVILYILLTAKMPFSALDVNLKPIYAYMQTYKSILEMKQPYDNVPIDAQWVLKHIFVDYRDRWTVDDILKSDWMSQ